MNTNEFDYRAKSLHTLAHHAKNIIFDEIEEKIATQKKFNSKFSRLQMIEISFEFREINVRKMIYDEKLYEIGL